MFEENKINNNEEKECKGRVQFILNEQKELVTIPKDQCRPVEHPINYRINNAFEVFVRVEGTENYWISNYGRCVNNLNHKDKNTFYAHKQGKCHITVFEIERYPVKDKRGQLTGEIAESRWRRETSPEELVAGTFLVKYAGRKKYGTKTEIMLIIGTRIFCM